MEGFDEERSGPLDVLWRVKGVRLHAEPQREVCPRCGGETRFIFMAMVGEPDDNDQVECCRDCLNGFLKNLWEWVP